MGIILNRGQQEIVNEAIKWYKSGNNQIFQIQGPPGTGKSVTINAIVDALGLDRNRIAPMSYIGAAAINMRIKGFHNAKTIHSWLYRPVDQVMVDEHGNIIKDTYFNKPKTHLAFEPKPLTDIDMMVIDEGYATPKSMKQEIESRNLPILVAGDKDQLSPVMDEPAYLVDGKIYYLTEIMRQAENSAIIYLSQRINNHLPIHSGYYGNVLVIDKDELNDNMIRKAQAIICGRNDTRDAMNKYVRENILGKLSDTPTYGEKLVCRKNNFSIELDGISLANGLVGTVMNNIDPSLFDGKNYRLDFKPDLMPAVFKGITCDYKYLISNAAERQRIKCDKFSTGEKFEYAYAITAHISQGSEWNNGIYLEEYLSPEVNTRLSYVGITRFRNSCVFVKRKKKFY